MIFLSWFFIYQFSYLIKNTARIWRLNFTEFHEELQRIFERTPVPLIEVALLRQRANHVLRDFNYVVQRMLFWQITYELLK